MNQELINDINEILAKHGWKRRLGDRVQKKKQDDLSPEWHGTICGIYFTEWNQEGYSVESEREKSSVQVYPERALEEMGGKE